MTAMLRQKKTDYQSRHYGPAQKQSEIEYINEITKKANGFPSIIIKNNFKDLYPCYNK